MRVALACCGWHAALVASAMNAGRFAFRGTVGAALGHFFAASAMVRRFCRVRERRRFERAYTEKKHMELSRESACLKCLARSTFDMLDILYKHAGFFSIYNRSKLDGIGALL